MDNPKPTSLDFERHQTDESLQEERRHADAVLEDKLADIEEAAVRALEETRDETNTVAVEARVKADRLVEKEAPAAVLRRVVAEERARQDAALESERRVTDIVLDQDRVAHARMLSALRPLARESTDRSLLIERRRSDTAVENRDHFLGIVSHDLRNLLGGIVFAASSLDGPQEPHPVADRLRRYAAHMDRLIGDLLDVSSIEAGRLSVSRRAGKVEDAVAEAVEAFEDRADHRGVSLELELTRTSLPATFDHDRLVQVVGNLLSNAIKFTPAGGRVVVRAADDGEDVHITVEDTGDGIPEAQLEAVFERFWKADTDDRKGTGLGLFISRHIVDAHGGRIWAERRARGGTRFLVTFPSDLASGDSSRVH